MLHFEKWKIAVIAVVVLLGLAYAAPNLLSQEQRDSLPSWLPNQSVNLGLDLQGGSHLLMEVNAQEVLDDRLADIRDSIRNELREIRPRVKRSGFRIEGNTVSFEVREPERLDQVVDIVRDVATSGTGGGFVGTGSPEVEVTVDGSRVSATLTEDGAAARLTAVVQQSVEIIRNRVDELGVSEPTIQQQGVDRVLVQAPGVEPDRLLQIIGQTAKMTFQLVDITADPYGDRVPPGSERLPERVERVERVEGDEQPDEDAPRVQYVVRKKIEVSGEHLVDAQPTFDQGQPVVSFRFDSVGAKKFAKTTLENVDRPFAIVLDGEVISAPRINSPILQGSGIITGGFTVQSANDLALLLRAGALPAELTPVEQRAVGPDLGADNIAAGQIASVLGFGLVIIFMFLAYGPVFGLAANVALITNLVLILGALSSLQATLTLPGIAGIVLTIGMAVDANVLIFERIREELRNGRSPLNAVEAGYKRAFVTIVDANVTTGFAAAILFAMGAGPVKGFAVTLGLGIISSMFTAILLTRLIVATWLRRKRPATLTV